MHAGVVVGVHDVPGFASLDPFAVVEPLLAVSAPVVRQLQPEAAAKYHGKRNVDSANCSSPLAHLALGHAPAKLVYDRESLAEAVEHSEVAAAAGPKGDSQSLVLLEAVWAGDRYEHGYPEEQRRILGRLDEIRYEGRL
jgi:hypothetical protein